MKLYPDDAMGGSDDPPDPPGPEPPLSILLQCDKGVHFDKYPNKEQCLVTEKENFHPPTRSCSWYLVHCMGTN